MKQFAERLRQLRLEFNMTQAQLGKIVNVSQRSISSWETECREPCFEMLVSLAKLFDVSAGFLLGDED